MGDIVEISRIKKSIIQILICMILFEEEKVNLVQVNFKDIGVVLTQCLHNFPFGKNCYIIST